MLQNIEVVYKASHNEPAPGIIIPLPGTTSPIPQLIFEATAPLSPYSLEVRELSIRSTQSPIQKRKTRRKKCPCPLCWRHKIACCHARQPQNCSRQRTYVRKEGQIRVKEHEAVA